LSNRFLSLFLITLIPALSLASATVEEKLPKAEDVAETVILVYGSRPALQQIRRNGIERGKSSRTLEDGRIEESTFEKRFIRGENSSKDRIRIDQKLPSAEYSIFYTQGRIWGLIGGTTFTPKPEVTDQLQAELWHDMDALLRYKENGSVVMLSGKEKEKNLDLWILDLTDKERRRTRYYVSAKTGRVLWLQYDILSVESGKFTKYKKTFHDFRHAQSTLVPFRSILYQNGKKVLENSISTVTYGSKMDESIFQSQ
jgi:hypothetical protein